MDNSCSRKGELVGCAPNHAPRAASLVRRSPCRVWGLDRETRDLGRSTPYGSLSQPSNSQTLEFADSTCNDERLRGVFIARADRPFLQGCQFPKGGQWNDGFLTYALSPPRRVALFHLLSEFFRDATRFLSQSGPYHRQKLQTAARSRRTCAESKSSYEVQRCAHSVFCDNAQRDRILKYRQKLERIAPFTMVRTLVLVGAAAIALPLTEVKLFLSRIVHGPSNCLGKRCLDSRGMGAKAVCCAC
jgi:hypothetical protein